ncbi:hypothetical protein M405DRAFT_378571 [Rhizopogon salebrosus TDB-379]|nr:hypothetical protein M405DRAFT_378571 [Rhizopogon salebrosus TDB-379]
MADHQPSVESAPTPSIRSLKSKFEQLAQESFRPSTPHPAAHKPHSTSSSLSPQLQSQDDQSSSSRAPHHQLRNTSSYTDLSSGQKRPPPPPPPSRSAKMPNPSPAVSPLLRPVPIPAALKSPFTSPDRSPVPRLQQDSDDDAPRGGGVASLRERFASNPASPPRPAPKPVPRPPYLMTNNEPNVLDSTPSVLPRHTKPASRILSSSHPVLSLEDTPFDPSENSLDSSPRMVGVASLRSRFS